MSNIQDERTLVLLKPDALERGIMGEIITRFERVGAKLVGMRLVIPDAETAGKHYTEDIAQRHGERVRNLMIELLTSGPVLAMVWEGIEIVEVVRKMIGSTEPKSAAPGTIRGDYSHVSFKHANGHNAQLYNIVHASATPEEAVAEVDIWFKPEELIHHDPAYTKFTLNR